MQCFEHRIALHRLWYIKESSSDVCIIQFGLECVLGLWSHKSSTRYAAGTPEISFSPIYIMQFLL